MFLFAASTKAHRCDIKLTVAQIGMMTSKTTRRESWVADWMHLSNGKFLQKSSRGCQIIICRNNDMFLHEVSHNRLITSILASPSTSLKIGGAEGSFKSSPDRSPQISPFFLNPASQSTQFVFESQSAVSAIVLRPSTFFTIREVKVIR